jgi:hypothetical protein
MSKFRYKPSSRRNPKPTASWLVTGLRIASEIQYGRRTTYMLPVKPNHHRRRFHDGQRLSLKAFVGGSTLAHVVVSDAQRIQLGQVDYSLVRELGYVRLDQFQVAWVEEHDQAWTAKLLEEFPDHVDVGERFCRKEDRFQARHAHREVWVIRFAVDHTETPRMLAQAGRDRASFVEGPDHRWRYRPGTEDAETDRGYTSVDSLSVRDAGRALTDEQHELHIARPARDREARRQAMLAATRAALTTEQRVTAARRAAASKGLDMRSEFRLYDRHVRLERAVEALRQLELIESRVFPQRRAA